MSNRSPTVLLRSGLPALPERLPRLSRQSIEAPAERRVLASYILTMSSVVLLTLLFNLVVVGQVQHYIAQRHLYAQFRQRLDAQSLPIGQTDPTTGTTGSNGLVDPTTEKLTKPGTPIAQLKIPAIGVNEIVVEGSSSYQTMDGIGHRPDTPLPGQPGVPVLMGRRAAYGGVFKHLADLKPGDTITAVTGEGTSTYQVTDVRNATTRLPVLAAGQGRMTLATASGGAFRPTGVTRVDAQLTSKPFGAYTPVLGAASIPASNQALAGDRSHTFALTWMLELLALLLVAAVWSWRRWTKAATWLVFVPALAATGFAAADAVCGMLPNLL